MNKIQMALISRILKIRTQLARIMNLGMAIIYPGLKLKWADAADATQAGVWMNLCSEQWFRYPSRIRRSCAVKIQHVFEALQKYFFRRKFSCVYFVIKSSDVISKCFHIKENNIMILFSCNLSKIIMQFFLFHTIRTLLLCVVLATVFNSFLLTSEFNCLLFVFQV